MPALTHDLASVPGLVAASGSQLGRPFHFAASTGSTNDDAKRAAKEGAPHGATWLAESQSAGRGRQGRTWLSPPGESLLFSVLLRVDLGPSKVPRVPLVAGLAVRDAVARAAPGARVAIKWPNDVEVDGRKVAGILVEAVTSPRSIAPAVIVGIGINVHTRVFPEEIAARATSIALLGNESRGSRRPPPDRAAILVDVLASLDRDVHLIGGRGLGLVRSRLEAADALRDRHVRSDDGDEGTACGIDDDGRLLVRRGTGTLVRWSSGEVHLLGTSDRAH
jgi:BirA family biotin operon repressor/biotin-[acetyl-CoA-carboxylase] ligase